MSVWKQSSLGKTCSPWPDEYFPLSRMIISCLDLEDTLKNTLWYGTKMEQFWGNISWCIHGVFVAIASWKLEISLILYTFSIYSHEQPIWCFRFLDRNKFKIWQHNESIRINSLFPRCFSKTAWIDCLGAWAYFSCKYLLSAMIRHITAVSNVLLIIPAFFFTPCAMWRARLSMKPEITQIGMDNVVK